MSEASKGLWNLPNDVGRCLERGLVPWDRSSGYQLALLLHSVIGQRLFLSVFQNLCLERSVAKDFSWIFFFFLRRSPWLENVCGMHSSWCTHLLECYKEMLYDRQNCPKEFKLYTKVEEYCDK